MHNGQVITSTRPTLRCLAEDLTHDWDDIEDHRLVRDGRVGTRKTVHAMGHKIIRKAVENFPTEGDDDKKRETISGLKDPHFYKVKVDRWRGAAYVDANGQAWLVAVGLRYEGESKDFYKHFMIEVSQNAERFLPTEQDNALLCDEVTETLIRQREDVTASLALEMLNEARESAEGLATAKLTYEARSGEQVTLADVTVLVAAPEATDEPYEVLVDLEVVDWSLIELLEWDEQVLKAALCACEGRWESTHATTRMHSLEVASERELNAMCRGDLSAMQPGILTAGRTTHTVHVERLTESIVNGEAVQALCGKWFVPRQDYMNLPLCHICEVLDRFLGLNPEALRSGGSQQVGEP